MCCCCGGYGCLFGFGVFCRVGGVFVGILSLIFFYWRGLVGMFWRVVLGSGLILGRMESGDSKC